MSETEYERWQTALAERFAAEQIAAGNWVADGAVDRARTANAALLPQGVATPRMLILAAVDETRRQIGRAWVGLDHPRGTPDTAFLYDIELEAEHRGRGLGKALLAATEEAIREAGVPALELNVFGSNEGAIGLYRAAGYAVTTQQMRKAL
jgi:ribosomal protein S18 acetylase RimI-like enzyme